MLIQPLMPFAKSTKRHNKIKTRESEIGDSINVSQLTHCKIKITKNCKKKAYIILVCES